MEAAFEWGFGAQVGGRQAEKKGKDILGGVNSVRQEGWGDGWLKGVIPVRLRCGVHAAEQDFP